ncbi:Methyltransferase domain-containing protein [Streptomyces sp. DvalAA-14]|uniref:SAM-dependent methyltransferase n=1 Tax=unclassified Streptomyces TaxID=2593676 RepID=UPI00081B6015|nr:MULTISPECIES: class I SAM-dependent methyltransferase [unclassified Streptomyces]MYS19633.1 methyltransferase domain-containing protein [Streptomyces sp. SID4948]SCD49381.1 Methyltransferase domain-containing protein [Streptomyces sp. DvalAA-14]
MTYAETDLVASMERLAGDDLAALTQEQRDQFDQFHAGGSEAVERLLPSLHLAPGMTVLDVGSGLGGPARQVARGSGCAVVGVDLTPAYVDAARELTRIAGLTEQVSFRCGDIAAFDGAAFDAAYTLHVQMNVEDKKTFFAEIGRRLLPGAHFATFEVCRSDGRQPTPPLPWSLDGTDSFLVTAGELRGTIRSSGFELVEWVDETAWVRQWFEDFGARIAAGGGQAALPALLTDGLTRMLNFAIALDTGVLSVHRGSFVKAP